MSDDKWTPLGQDGMVMSRSKTHRFLTVTFKRFTWCDWCKGFIWGLGKQGLRCAECKYAIHKKCEAAILHSHDKEKKACRMAKEVSASGERPIFRFKVKEKGASECLLEIDPNESVPVLYFYTPNLPKMKVACSDVFSEKLLLNPKQLILRFFETKKIVQFSSRREREQLAGALSYLSHRVTSSPSVVPLRVWMGTWNMGDAPPPEGLKLSDWCKVEEDFDIICFTVQECEYKPRAGYKSCEEDWFKTTEALVGPKYFRVDKLSLEKIRVIVFAKTAHRDYITQIESATEATGIGGVYGNKGGVCVSFTIRETRLCFVGCHLAAHQEKVQDRNSDYMEIVDEMSKKLSGRKNFWFTNEYHHVFWAGDLNYRIDYDRGKVVQMCYQGLEGWKELYNHDQLQKELAKETVFIDFNESQPLFQPTYKYDRMKNVYPDDSKQRIPSWCDRILWKSLHEHTITQLEYDSVQTVFGSDHRPVYAVFKLECKNPYIPRSVLNVLTHAPVLGSEVADILDPKCNGCFVIRHLAGHDLEASDPNGYSDPYVVFVSNVLQNDYKTGVQSKTLNPTWGGKEKENRIPVLYVNFEEKEYLESESISFNVYDYDISTADDPLGQGHLDLKGLTDGQPHSFCVRLLGAGKATGLLTGVIQFAVND
eukprot:TRINITY_DN1856_c0_g1_i5.p2 TRINITY_DN1856_c0_g1~~TRINITY_DN1856_c0_g1_i5.p2  ORF type:complete len:651 (+),score=195.85 TRINITY_DN1856_c0_g1_i5:2581-4533(+)